jgi:hypothetical protein
MFEIKPEEEFTLSNEVKPRARIAISIGFGRFVWLALNTPRQPSNDFADIWIAEFFFGIAQLPHRLVEIRVTAS